jgi:hypothetical protein
LQADDAVNCFLLEENPNIDIVPVGVVHASVGQKVTPLEDPDW